MVRAFPFHPKAPFILKALHPMIRRLILPLVFGLSGAAVLIGLGSWQMNRLVWKQDILARIEARIADEPRPLPDRPDPATDTYLPVSVAGTLTGEGIEVLVSRKQRGAGYRMIAVLETDTGRRILIDRGFLLEAQRATTPRATGPATVRGNLLWPVEVDSYTPAPDAARGIWFARDLPAMAAALATEPVLVIASAITPPDPGVEPMPVDSAHIPNDHLTYAITWFSLAVAWLGMTALLLWRIWRRMP